MKRSWIGFALLLVLLAGGIAATWGMSRSPGIWKTPRKRRFREIWPGEKR